MFILFHEFVLTRTDTHTHTHANIPRGYCKERVPCGREAENKIFDASQRPKMKREFQLNGSADAGRTLTTTILLLQVFQRAFNKSTQASGCSLERSAPAGVLCSGPDLVGASTVWGAEVRSGGGLLNDKYCKSFLWVQLRVNPPPSPQSVITPL